MKSTIIIKPCSIKDAEVITSLSVKTFTDTFESMNTPENMKHYIDDNLTFKKLQAELAESNTHFALALYDKTPVGYVKLKTGNTSETLEHNKAIEIERLYAVKDYIGQRVGQQLMLYSLEYAKSMSCNLVWLGVWERNERAISFYQKFGFKKFSDHVFMLGNDPQNDLLMKINL